MKDSTKDLLLALAILLAVIVIPIVLAVTDKHPMECTDTGRYTQYCSSDQ